MSNYNTIENWDRKWIKMKEPMEKDCWVKIRMKTVASLITVRSSVLDVACGTGYIEDFVDVSVNYTGMDFSRKGLRHVKGKKIFCDVRNAILPVDNYDTILLMEIVEHLDNPGALIAKAGLSAKSQVIITVPNNRMGPESNVFHVAKYDVKGIVDLIKASYEFKSIKVLTPGGNIICQCVK